MWEIKTAPLLCSLDCASAFVSVKRHVLGSQKCVSLLWPRPYSGEMRLYPI